MSLNVTAIQGRLTRDPDYKLLTSGIGCATFTLAVERDHSSKADGTKETDFLDVVAWRNCADFATKYLTKGRMVVVHGRLQSRNWEDKSGNKRKSVEIMAECIYFSDSKPADDRGTYGGYQPSEPTDYEEVTGDDGSLPF